MKTMCIIFSLVCFVLTVSAATYDVQNVTWTSASYVTVSGNTLTKVTSSNSWDGGAFSVQSIASGKNGYLEMTAQETGTYRMFGFSSTNLNNSYSSIQFAIYLVSGSTVQIYESGNQMYTGGLTYTTGDVFRVAREGTVVRYYKNGSLFYTSSTASTGALYADTSLYTLNATIYNAKIAVEAVPEPTTLAILGLVLVIFSTRKIR